MNETTKGIHRMIGIAPTAKETAVQRFDEDALLRLMQLDDAVKDMANAMTDKQKAVFVRRCILQQSIAEISAELDISPSTVSQHVSTALHKLSTGLAEIE